MEPAQQFKADLRSVQKNAVMILIVMDHRSAALMDVDILVWMPSLKVIRYIEFEK